MKIASYKKRVLNKIARLAIIKKNDLQRQFKKYKNNIFYNFNKKRFLL